MKIQWYGHSCFSLWSASGFCAVTDPCDPGTGYFVHISNPDVVTVSHSHHDHNYLPAVSGNPQVIQSEGSYKACNGILIQGFPSFHDKLNGKLRGRNILYLFEMDHFRILHLGDLGHIPSEELIRDIGRVDILLCPVGGTYTIDASEALHVVKLFHPSVCIPMHYQTESLAFPLSPVDLFLDLCIQESLDVIHMDSSVFETENELYPSQSCRIVVLDFTS